MQIVRLPGICGSLEAFVSSVWQLVPAASKWETSFRLTCPCVWYHSPSGDLIALTCRENSLWSRWPVAQ